LVCCRYEAIDICSLRRSTTRSYVCIDCDTKLVEVDNSAVVAEKQELLDAMESQLIELLKMLEALELSINIEPLGKSRKIQNPSSSISKGTHIFGTYV